MKKQQQIVKISYMGILCITLKERNTNRLEQNWHSQKSSSTEWSWFLFIEFVFFSFLLYSWIIAIFKECMIKGRNSHCLYAHKLYCNALKLNQNWKSCKMCAILTIFSSFEVSFNICKLSNAIYMLRVSILCH